MGRSLKKSLDSSHLRTINTSRNSDQTILRNIMKSIFGGMRFNGFDKYKKGTSTK